MKPFSDKWFSPSGIGLSPVLRLSPICLSGCKSIQAGADVRLSLHGVSLSVRLLPFCPPISLSVPSFVRLPICLSLCLPMYLSVRLPICPCYLSACLSMREMGHTAEIPYRNWNHGARCPVSPSDDRIMNIFINGKVIQ